MLDEGARQWLELIESKRNRLQAIKELSDAEGKRNARLKPGKNRAASTALLVAWAAEEEELNTFIETETKLFFEKVLKISLYQKVVLMMNAKVQSKAIIATAFLARLLSSGTAVYSVIGDSLTKDMHKGLPAMETLTAEEAKDQYLVAV